jgi:acyl-CoA hydrolase/GNAT superfamily N-acetyltransferase
MTKSWRDLYRKRLVSVEQALTDIPSGSRVFVGTAAGEPRYLTRNLAHHPAEMADAELVQVWPLTWSEELEPATRGRFRMNSFYPGDELVSAILEGRADHTPVFLSKLAGMFRSHLIHLDAALIQVSPPDEHGYMSLGVSVDVTKAAARHADLVIAQINPEMPRTHGDGFLHVSEIDHFVRHSEMLTELPTQEGTEVHERIGRFLSQLVADGSTLHVGLGQPPKSTVANLMDRREIGVHTEFFGDWLVDLVEAGVITNRSKTLHAGKVIASYCMGTQKLYDYVHDNPAIELRPSSYVNDPRVIARNDRMVSISNAYQVDLTGQVASSMAHDRYYAGPEGQADFMRGAAASRGGCPIVALASTGQGSPGSRIVPKLDSEVVVTSTRADVHYVVTEYGIAHLAGKSVRERALALIDIAHPDVRAELLTEAKNRRYVYPDQLPPARSYADPCTLSAKETLKDGTTIELRPVRSTDERNVQELFHNLSDRDRYFRFFSSIQSLPHREAQKLCHSNFRDEMAIVASVPRGEGEMVVGSGQFLVDRRHSLADIAVMVRRDHQNLGIGTALLKHLIRLARRQGIRGLKAQVMPGNHAMLHLIKKSGFPVDTELRNGALDLTLLFDELPVPMADHQEE